MSQRCLIQSFNCLLSISLRLSKVAESTMKTKLGAHVRNLVLDICCNDKDGEDLDVPYIKYNFR